MWSCDAVKNLDEREWMSSQSFHRARPGVAAELVAAHPGERIQTMLELHDWHNSRGQKRGPGFIVAGIRSNEPHSLPKRFRPSHQAAKNSRIAPPREKRAKVASTQAEDENLELRRFMDFWDQGFQGPTRADAQSGIRTRSLRPSGPSQTSLA